MQYKKYYYTSLIFLLNMATYEHIKMTKISLKR